MLLAEFKPVSAIKIITPDDLSQGMVFRCPREDSTAIYLQTGTDKAVCIESSSEADIGFLMSLEYFYDYEIELLEVTQTAQFKNQNV